MSDVCGVPSCVCVGVPVVCVWVCLWCVCRCACGVCVGVPVVCVWVCLWCVCGCACGVCVGVPVVCVCRCACILVYVGGLLVCWCMTVAVWVCLCMCLKICKGDITAFAVFPPLKASLLLVYPFVPAATSLVTR